MSPVCFCFQLVLIYVDGASISLLIVPAGFYSHFVHICIANISCLPLIVPCLFLLTVPMLACHTGSTMGLDGALGAARGCTHQHQLVLSTHRADGKLVSTPGLNDLSLLDPGPGNDCLYTWNYSGTCLRAGMGFECLKLSLSWGQTMPGRFGCVGYEPFLRSL